MTAPDPVDTAEANLLKREPTMARWVAAAAAAAAGGFLFTHFGVDADTTKQILVPAVTGVVLTGFGVFNRRVVTPTVKVAKQVEAEVNKRLAALGIETEK